MCRGVPQESIQGSFPAHISLLHEQLKRVPHADQHYGNGDITPAVHTQRNGTILSRGNPLQPKVPELAPLGLAIVAAIQSELVQSPASTLPGHVIDVQLGSAATSICRQMREKPGRRITDSPGIERKLGGKKNGVVKKSIFSLTFSPLDNIEPDCSSGCSHGSPDHDFLGACFFCKRLLGPSKDIYIYRGDRAFCSGECRYQHILAEERSDFSLQRAKSLSNQRSPARPLKMCSSIAVLS